MTIERKKVITPQSRSTVRNLNTGQATNQQPEEETTQGEDTTTQDEEDASKRRPKKPKDKQILMGLKQLKKFDILHRDIKPGKILIRKRNLENFQIVLADFGLAGKYTEQSEYFYGTAYFKAPEVFDETTDVVDDRSDVWSTGIIMLEKMYWLDKRKYPRAKCDSERDEWYANWLKEVRRTVESINRESELGGLMRIMLEEIFVDLDKRVDAKRCLGIGSRIKLWGRHSIPMRWWKSWVKWVDGVPEMRQKDSPGERARKRNATNTG
ncbi:hypothetical protein LB506_007790 [Fusarium annulatum]|nr:hypothetical protein LB506_007790 [Fusarium annulatum]